MRLATSTRTLLPLALSAVLATCALAQEHPNISPNSVRDQLNQPNSPPQGSQSPSQQGPSQAEVKMPKKRAAPPAKAPAQAPAKAPAQTPAKAKATAPGKAATGSPAKAAAKPAEGNKAPAKEPAKTAAASPAKPPAEKVTAEKAPEEKAVVRRDPFDTLLTKARASNAPPENLPPGKAGLIVATLRIDGIVHSPNGMIAIVSNSQQRVYFLREGDKLYDGSVDKIALDAISFHEVGKDAFGKPLERVVTKQLYPTSGEQR